jgi:hypothetical protein
MLTCTTIVKQTNEVVRPNSIGMLIEYATLGFIQEGGVNPTQTGDAKDKSILVIDSYQDKMRVEYSSEHEDSMELQLMELVHTSTRKARYVKRSYEKRI